MDFFVERDSIRAWEQGWRDRAALVQLEADLKEALKHRGVNDRQAAKDALGAVLDFLYAHRDLTAQNLHTPLADLLAALKTLDKGRVSPMLNPRWAGNSPPFGETFRKAKGHALFAVEQLIERGDKVFRACEAVAETWNATVGGKATAADTIRSWYYRSSRLPVDDPERVVIAALRQGLEKSPQIKTFTKAEILKLILAANLRSLGTATIVERG